MDRPPEEKWLAGLARGEDEAFAEVYDSFAAMLYRVARRLARADHDAEDLVQETIVGLARSMPVLRNAGELKAYLLTSLRHAAGRLAQRRTSSRTIALEGDPPAAAQARGADPELAVALSRLPRDQREVVALKIDADMTFDEIGRALDISPNTAASRYRYALEKLRLLVKEPEHG